MSGDGRGGDTPPARVADIRRSLDRVVDPEVGLDVVTLGLIYGIRVEEEAVRIRYTLTTPGCPMGEVLRRSMHAATRSVPGVERVEMELVWNPRWDPRMIAKGVLG